MHALTTSRCLPSACAPTSTSTSQLPQLPERHPVGMSTPQRLATSRKVSSVVPSIMTSSSSKYTVTTRGASPAPAPAPAPRLAEEGRALDGAGVAASTDLLLCIVCTAPSGLPGHLLHHLRSPPDSPKLGYDRPHSHLFLTMHTVPSGLPVHLLHEFTSLLPSPPGSPKLACDRPQLTPPARRGGVPAASAWGRASVFSSKFGRSRLYTSRLRTGA
mmetsp:Transcript_57311/g.181393  ORF Transcript_57311/g.181393 Transcript_57311/m.181393 type:complete len:216 (+) Transcript_57311:344-991(+)